MNASNNARKWRHIRTVLSDPEVDRKSNFFEAIRLRHRALPELNLDEVSTEVTFLGKRLSFPLIISSMTGGDHPVIRKINRNLAVAAEQCRVALAVGSQRVMFSHEGSRNSFALRRYAPSTVLLANLGAVQLNYGFGIRECREAVRVVGADGLYLHLNPLQEAIQPGGNVNFSGLAKKIGNIARQLNVPVIVKEVGAGLSPDDVRLLVQHGIRYVDVAGSGGTSWSRIEHHELAKRTGSDLGLAFQDWGVPTPIALQQLKPFRRKLTIIASGGIRSGIDMVKALVLGASLCGIAKPFLEPATHSVEAVVSVIEELRNEFRVAMFLLGVRRVSTLIGNEKLIL